MRTCTCTAIRQKHILACGGCKQAGWNRHSLHTNTTFRVASFTKNMIRHGKTMSNMCTYIQASQTLFWEWPGWFKDTSSWRAWLEVCQHVLAMCVCVSWPIRVYRFMMSAPRAHYRFDMDKAHYDMVKYCHFNHQSEVACAASCLDFTKILIALSSDPRRNRIERRPLGTWSFQSKVLFPLLVRGVENCLWGWCDVTCFKRSCLWPKVKWGFENWSEA